MKTNFLNLLVALATILIGIGFASAEQVSGTDLVAKGAKLYSENCGRCHNPRPATDYSKEEWSVVMPHMREKAHMTGKEAMAVEAFLASTLTADVRNDMMNKDVAKVALSGETLVKQFGCQGCHTIQGVGGKLGPDLDNVIEKKGREFFIQKLKDPKFDNASSAMPRFPMTDQDLESIINFMNKK